MAADPELLENDPGRVLIRVRDSIAWPVYHLGTLGWIAERFEDRVRGGLRELGDDAFDVELTW